MSRLNRIAVLVAADKEHVKILAPWHLDYHHGQDDYAIYAVVGADEVVVGKLEYSVYEDQPSISWIKVAPDYERRGIGQRLIAKLTEEYPYQEIRWGYTTEPGDNLKKKIDKDFQFYKDRGYDMYGRGVK